MDTPVEMIKVVIGTRTELWPKQEYLDYKAASFGFEDYADLKAHGYHLNEE